MSKKGRKIKICALCGAANVNGSHDHLPPRAIFQKPRPKNLITVPACIPCNNAGSKHDETFKTFLAFLLGQTPLTDSLYESAISTARKKFSRFIFANMRRVNLATSAGTIYDQAYICYMTPELANSFDEVMKRITAGLYYHHFNQFIGSGATFQVRYHKAFRKEMLEGVAYSVNRIGNGHFTYCYARSVENSKTMSLWVFEFYKKFWVSCGALFDSAGQPM